jgi:hypothetical protein
MHSRLYVLRAIAWHSAGVLSVDLLLQSLPRFAMPGRFDDAFSLFYESD